MIHIDFFPVMEQHSAHPSKSVCIGYGNQNLILPTPMVSGDLLQKCHRVWDMFKHLRQKH